MAAAKLAAVAFFTSPIILYAPDAILTAFSISVLFFSKEHSKKTLVALALLTTLAFIGVVSDLVNNADVTEGLISRLRTLSPILFYLALGRLAPWCGTAQTLKAANDSIFIVVLVMATVVWGLVSLPSEMNRGIERLPTAFAGLHDSSYTLMSAAVLAYSAWLIRPTSRKTVLLVVISVFTVYMLAFGWAIRTTAIFYMSFMALVLLRKFGVGLVITASTGAYALAAVLLFLIAFGVVSNEDLVNYTSGRTAVYVERLQIISEGNTFQLLLGRGEGSDILPSDIWWWAPKGSHNDFITFQIESGAIFVAALILLLILIVLDLESKSARLLFLLGLSTSAMSNGYLVRPSSTYIFFLAIFLLELSYSRSRALRPHKRVQYSSSATIRARK